MNKQTEALKLALEALRDYRRSDDDRVSVAMGILQEALASEANEQCVCGEPNTPGTHRTDGPCLAEQPAQQDSTCNKKLREQGKAYPRTCKKCGLGPCIADRVQPAQQQEPVALSQAVYTVLEGFTLPHDVRKILESAYYSDQPASKPWLGLTQTDLVDCDEEELKQARYWENKLKEKNT